MNTNNVTGPNANTAPIRYTFSRKKSQADVHPLHLEEAVEIDSDKDKHLSDVEIKNYLKDRQILRDPKHYDVDEAKIVDEYKMTLQNKPLPQSVHYHSYDEVVSDMKDLQARRPDLCKMVSFGKTHEGRDIWALKVSKNTGDKKKTAKKHAVVITGGTHAREWIGVEVPTFAMKAMVENYDSDPKMKHRVDNAETYFVPVANPDGYTYSKDVNAWWRKNRQPITQDACDISGGKFNLADETGKKAAAQEEKGDVKGIGVDINRNYYDGNPQHMFLYRPDGDSPCSTWDDKGASDRIRSDTYRGPEGGSEKETKALMDFEKQNRNVKAAIDFHSYGRMILYPPGHDYGQVENHAEYEKVGKRMADIIKDSDDSHINYKVMTSSDLYPATGSSEDFQEKQGILGFTIELSRSFAPSESEIQPTSRRLLGAQMALVDYVIDNGDHMRQ